MANVLDATLYKATLHNDIKAVENALNKGANSNANDFTGIRVPHLLNHAKTGKRIFVFC